MPSADGEELPARRQVDGARPALDDGGAEDGAEGRRQPAMGRVEVNTTRLTGTRNDVSSYDWLTTSRRQPPRPAMKPDTANAVKLGRQDAHAVARRGACWLAGSAGSTRPVRLWRRPCRASSTSTRTPRQSSNTAVCEVIARPNR